MLTFITMTSFLTVHLQKTGHTGMLHLTMHKPILNWARILHAWGFIMFF